MPTDGPPSTVATRRMVERMIPLRFFRQLCIAVVVLGFSISIAGCSEDDSPDALFSPDDPPTPNILRGTYRLIVDEPGLTTEVRLRFTDDAVAGAARCDSKAKKGSTVIIGGDVELHTDALDEASGRFDVVDLVLDKNVGDISCQAGLRAGTYDFQVEDLRLSLTSKDLPAPLIYEKVGQ